jgi:phage shock protein PspC (stress-responsive transcriptional regulator)
MNRTLTINVGGFSFVIDEDAYQMLQNYLTELNRYFSKRQGAEDIVADIEYRLAELLKQSMGAREVVIKNDVSNAIERLGRPEVFESDWEEVGNNYAQGEEDTFFKDSKKKLWRNPEEKIIAGVCSGLSAYFGINDPIWIRLIFVVVFFSGGAGILIYLILWLIVPEAKSAADRLSMRGENIDIDNIAKEVESTLQNLGEKIYSLGKNIQTQAKKGPSPSKFSSQSKGLNQFLRDFFQLVVGLVEFVVKTLLMVLLFALGLAFSAMTIGLFVSLPVLSVLLPFSSTATFLLLLGASLLMVIPLINLILWAGGWISNPETRKKILSFSAFLWICCLFTTATAGIQTYSSLAVTAHSIDKTTLSHPQDTLILGQLKMELYDSKQFFDLIYAHGEHYVENVNIHLKISPDDQLHISEKKIASGSNRDDAIHHGSSFEYPWTHQNNALRFPSLLQLTQGFPYKRQRIEIDLEIPVHTVVKLERGFQEQLLTSISMKPGEKPNKRQFNQVLMATENGFTRIQN